MAGDNRFRPGVVEKLAFYVYLLLDPRDGRVFYIGKGSGDRCFAHLDEARTTAADSKGDYVKLTTIRAIEAADLPVRIEILRHGLTESEAFAVEAAAIDLLGLTELANRIIGADARRTGRMSIADVNALYGATPVTIAEDEPVVLIRVSRAYEAGMGEDALYEVTRRWWRLSPRRMEKARWAFAVYRGVVRAAYRIDSWADADEDAIVEDPRRVGRWMFTGRRDHEMEQRYLFRDVTDYLPAAARNPIRYVNC